MNKGDEMKVWRCVILATAMMMTNSAFADTKAGVRIGNVKLTDAKDKDVVVLPHCSRSRNKRVSQLAFNVSRAPAEIDALSVVYYNGERETLTVKDHFKVNTSSRWIDLKGSSRCIAKIVVKGDADTVRFRPGKKSMISFVAK